jgi:hypothetical protein
MFFQNLLKSRLFPIVIIITFLFLISYVFLAFLGILIPNESQQTIGDISRWCEKISGSIFREPVNALSNLGYMVAGLLMFSILSRESKSSRSVNQFYGLNSKAILYASATIFLGAGSMLMHGTNTDWGRWADNLSMIMYIILPWLINLAEIGKWSKKKFLIIYVVIILIYALARWFFGTNLGINLDLFRLSIALWMISEMLFRFWTPLFRYLSGLIGFVVAAVFGIMPLEMFLNIDRYWWIVLFWLPALISKKPVTKRRSYIPWFVVGVSIYVLAFYIWLQGYPDTPFCDPDSFIQPHAIWHLLTAFSTWCFFKFLRTENTK